MKQTGYNHPIEEIMDTAMSKLKTIIDVNTVIGNPINNEKQTIIPISRVTVGFVAGGGEYNQINENKNSLKEYPFAGGSGAGFNICPVGFLVSEEGKFRIVDIETDGTTSSLLELVGKIYNGFTSGNTQEKPVKAKKVTAKKTTTKKEK